MQNMNYNATHLDPSRMYHVTFVETGRTCLQRGSRAEAEDQWVRFK